MIFWLGVNKELHHKMNTMAEWNNVDLDDILTWQDWFEHGLSKLCVFSFNPLSANPTIWGFADKLFECVRPFCGVGA